jgi:predicted HTH domain antitoxin
LPRKEVLGLWIDRPEHAVIEETIRLPADLRTAIQRSRRTRERAERERQNAQEQTRVAAQALVEEGVSLRDAGELLGLSHQRVQQLVQARWPYSTHQAMLDLSFVPQVGATSRAVTSRS